MLAGALRILGISLVLLILSCGGGSKSDANNSVNLPEVIRETPSNLHPIKDAEGNLEVCVFLWNGEEYLDKREELLDSLISEGINCLLFSSNHIDYLMGEGRYTLKDFVDNLRVHGIRFEIVLSKNRWIFPYMRGELLEFLGLYKDFVKFYGSYIPINLDIEPHVISSQTTGEFITPYYRRLYLDTLREAKNSVGRFNPVISYAYRYYGLDKDVLEYTDTLVVMLYLNQLDRIRENVNYYRSITKEKKLRIALSVEESIVGGFSFYYKDKEELRTAIGVVATEGAESIVFQDYFWLMSYLER